jgi:hypothetical protein
MNKLRPYEDPDFSENPFYEVRCISVVSASKKKPMEKESVSFTMWMLSR